MRSNWEPITENREPIQSRANAVDRGTVPQAPIVLGASPRSPGEVSGGIAFLCGMAVAGDPGTYGQCLAARCPSRYDRSLPTYRIPSGRGVRSDSFGCGNWVGSPPMSEGHASLQCGRGRPAPAGARTLARTPKVSKIKE